MNDERKYIGTLTCECGWELQIHEGLSDDLIDVIVRAHQASRRHRDAGRQAGV
jgi:hypothetical protein